MCYIPTFAGRGLCKAMPEGWEDFSIDARGTFGDARGDGGTEPWSPDVKDAPFGDTGPLHVDFSSTPVGPAPTPVGASIFASLVPVGWVLGKEQDELTQQGVATFLLIALCVLALAAVGTYFVWTCVRNRRGHRGTLRKVARGEFANSKKVE